MRRTATLCLTLSLSIPPTPVRAQDSTATESAKAVSGSMLGGTLMIPHGTGSALSEVAAVGITYGPARPNRPGADLAVVIVPRAIGYGAVIGGVRANIGVPIAAGRHLLIVPSAGLSLIGAYGVGGGGGARGANATIAAIYFADPQPASGPSVGLRAALAFHQFGGDEGGGFRMLEIGIVRIGR